MKKPELTFPKEVAQYVEQAYRSKDVIFEYGSGGSTILAAEIPGKTIVTVESDPVWLCRLNTYIQHTRLPSLPVTLHQDIGPTKKWGYPLDETKWRNFPKYSLGIWQYSSINKIDPDIVLIDGRFRVACFLASIIHLKSTTTILFDDYLDREYYHVIEKICKPSAFVDRMAIFNVEPANVDSRSILDLLDYFYIAE